MGYFGAEALDVEEFLRWCKKAIGVSFVLTKKGVRENDHSEPKNTCEHKNYEIPKIM